jgi:NitT/TauT family transport system permease protein
MTTQESTARLELLDSEPGWSRTDPVNILIPLVFVVIAGAWELIVRVTEVPAYIWPAPSAIAFALYNGILSGVYPSQLWYTFCEAAGGFLIAAVLGLIIGGIISQFRLVERTLYPYLIALQTTPKIAIAPLVVMWMGFGISSKITVAAMVGFFPVLVNVIVGLRTVEGEKLALMRSLGASRWQIMRFILLPNALPFIFAGLNIALVFSITGAIVGEFVGSRQGIGNLILQMNFNLDTAGVFAALVCLAAMGVTLHLAVQWLQRRLVFWSEPDHPVGT